MLMKLKLTLGANFINILWAYILLPKNCIIAVFILNDWMQLFCSNQFVVMRQISRAEIVSIFRIRIRMRIVRFFTTEIVSVSQGHYAIHMWTLSCVFETPCIRTGVSNSKDSPAEWDTKLGLAGRIEKHFFWVMCMCYVRGLKLKTIHGPHWEGNCLYLPHCKAQSKGIC